MNSKRIGLSSVVLGGCLHIAGCSGSETDWASDVEVGVIDSPLVCGTEDWQHVESYTPVFGVPASFVEAHMGPVNHGGCTGTMIAPNIYITAGHCTSEESFVVGGKRRFNHQLDPSGANRTEDVHLLAELLEDGLGGLDYAILRTDGEPGNIWGVTVPSVFAPTDGETAVMIHHPGAGNKRVSVSALTYATGQELRYDLDTAKGSSGAGVLQASTGYMIGVHSGAKDSSPCTNGGPSILQIWEHSPIIRQLSMDPAKVMSVAG